MIAAGLGCRKGCSHEDLQRALEGALVAAARGIEDVRALFAPDFKAEEPALHAIARELAKPLQLLCPEQLQLQAAHALTHSAHVSARFDLPSIAETAALAGARLLAPSSDSRPRLLGPRHVAGNATCALAVVHLGDSQ